MDDALDITLLSVLIEAADRSEVLRKARRPEFRIRQAQIVAGEMRVFLQIAGQQTPAQSTISQGCETRLPAIRQKLVFDLTLEQIVGRLDDVQLSDPAKALDLPDREIADADGPDFSLVEERLHRLGGLFDRHQRVWPMHLVDVDVIGLEPPQRVVDLAQDPLPAGIAKDFSVSPLQRRLSSDDDARPQIVFGNGSANDFFGAANP